jgi:3-dehydroquinate synthase
VVGRSCEIKAEVISRDEREANLRRILNFGHTFGHALEAATGFSAISHGEAVAYGIIAATSLSGKLGALDQPTVDRIIRCIRSVGSLPSINHVAVSAVLEAMARDKKRQHDEIHFVLLSAIGKTFVRDNLQEAVLRDVWRVVVGGGPGAWSTNPL